MEERDELAGRADGARRRAAVVAVDPDHGEALVRWAAALCAATGRGMRIVHTGRCGAGRASTSARVVPRPGPARSGAEVPDVEHLVAEGPPAPGVAAPRRLDEVVVVVGHDGSSGGDAAVAWAADLTTAAGVSGAPRAGTVARTPAVR